ncbi:accessory gene regulator B family protein [Clostridium sp. MSJ-11]|uniref:Accessory gene regulator B family protein n=1 Tax=Clostridium mobile TaxID=2841512 RepID=A0ABS6ENK2_9CLOT|nr:accessory gene regulator B family protein [Clostridium mobile]MBU5485949.1 accessory gene regulator B family protein [Clostridium mobile]
MFNIESISNNIATKLASELNFDKDKREVIAYGTFAFLQMIFSIALVIIFGWIFHVEIEALVISFVASILRKYSGGAHASSPSRCALIGTIVCIGQAVLFKFALAHKLNFNMVLLLGIMIFVWSYYMIYKLAPVDSPAKPIRKKEKRIRLKKSSIIILSAYLIITVFILMLYKKTGGQSLLIYTLCIYGGTVWQVFTLTEGGHLILGKIDTFLKHIY